MGSGLLQAPGAWGYDRLGLCALRVRQSPSPPPAAPDPRGDLSRPPNFRVAFDGNRYSVPWRLVGKPLTLRADAETVTFWYGTHRVARHPRCWRRGGEVVTPAHADGLLATKPGAQAHWQVAAVEVSAVMQKSPPRVIQNSPPVTLLRRRSDDGSTSDDV